MTDDSPQQLAERVVEHLEQSGFVIDEAEQTTYSEVPMWDDLFNRHPPDDQSSWPRLPAKEGLGKGEVWP